MLAVLFLDGFKENIEKLEVSSNRLASFYRIITIEFDELKNME